MSMLHMLRRRCRLRNVYVREILAEFIGTLLLVVIGCGGTAQSVLSDTAAGTFLSVDLTWGFGVMFGVFVSGGVSGGHINPAVSMAMALLGKFPWRKVPLYMVAQYAGAFCGAAVTYFTYHDALHEYLTTHNNSMLATASIFATYPKQFLTVSNGLADQVTGTAILMACICAITDGKNMGTAKGIAPLMIGLCVASIGIAYGYNYGFAINPARDLGPRLFTAVAGWGNFGFSYGDYMWWWIPIVGPYVGAILGAFIYWSFIESHWPEDDDELSFTRHSIDAVEIVEVRKVEKH